MNAEVDFRQGFKQYMDENDNGRWYIPARRLFVFRALGGRLGQHLLELAGCRV